MPHATQLQLCENCGAKLEVPHRWQKIMVCGPCLEKLSSPEQFSATSHKKQKAWPSAIAGALMLGLIVTAIIASGRGTHAPRLAGGHSLATEQPGNPVDMLITLPSVTPQFNPLVADEEMSEQPETEPSLAPTTTGTIAGVAWLTRNGGAVEPQRGLRIQLIHPTVSRLAMQAALAAEARDWQDWIDLYTALAAEARQTDANADAADPNTPNAPNANAATDAGQEFQTVADQATTALNRVTAAMRVVPQQLDSLTALRTLTELAHFNLPDFSDALLETTIVEVRTDATGAFQLGDIPTGDYYLHAAVGGRQSFVEWCVPVRVEANEEPLRIELSNANALVLQGMR
jgi:hypothetical protein